MQVDRIAGVARLAGGVRGLGVCDVLRVELDPAQRSGLLEQLRSRIATLERVGRGAADEGAGDALDEGAGDALDEGAGDAPDEGAGDAPDEAADDPARVHEELRLLARIRADLPPSAADPFTLTGPAGLVLDLVGACLSRAVATAHARLGEGEPGVLWVAGCERELEAAAAWITTSLECHAVEAFSFEPGADPVHAW